MKTRFWQKLVTSVVTTSLVGTIIAFPGEQLLVAQESDAAAGQVRPSVFSVTNTQVPATTAGQTLWTITLTKNSALDASSQLHLTTTSGTNVTTLKMNGVDKTSDENGRFALTGSSTEIAVAVATGESLTAEFFGGESGTDLLQTTQLAAQAATTETSSSSSSDASTAETSSTGQSETTTSSTQETTSSETTSSSTTASADKSAALSAAPFNAPFAGVTGNPEVPKGAILLDGVFGALNSDAGSSSSSTGVNTIHDVNANNGVPYSEVSLSGKKSWLSLWSNKTYRLDFTKSFHGRTYMNFGNDVDSDGLAFVMQNQGESALTTANGGSDGQNLGVYGYADTGLLMTTPEKAAIKKSVAIEFDLHTNKGGYDMDNQETPHMAYAFPGNLSKGYRSTGFLGAWGINDTAVIRHNASTKLNGVIGDNIRDNTWYEFRYDFDVTTKTFSYYMKNPVTDAQTTPVTIPWADLSSELALSANNNKAYWGFTAANGSASGEVKFVFTQVPVDLSAKIKNDVVSEGKSVVDTDDHENLEPGVPVAADDQPITFSTTFSVEAGEVALAVSEWESYLTAKDIDLTKGVRDVTATIGTKTYPGTATLDASTGDVVVTFPNLTIQPGQSATLSYVAEPLKHDATSKSYFSSNVTTKEVGNGTVANFLSQSVAFWINGNQAPVLSDLRPDKLTYSDFVDRFTYVFSYLDADSDELTANVTLNGEAILTDQKFAGLPTKQDYLHQDGTTIDLLAAANHFKLGENTLKVMLTDGINPPVEQERTFNVTGYYGFEELTDTFAWKYARTDLPTTTTPMAREAGMTIKIRDTRTPGATQKATVNVSATSGDQALTTDQFTFDQQALSGLEFPVNQELTYQNDQGLLLKLNNAETAKKVAGTVTWTIVDAL